MSTPPVVAFEQVRKTYGDVRALDGLSFTIERGGIIGLLGPNGAGKTTALHLVLGLLTPDGGRIQVFGQSPVRQRPAVMQRLNFASAYTSLPSNLTVTENLRIFARLYGVPNTRQAVEESITRFDLAAFRRTTAGRLSSGEQMRLNLAKSFLNHPELLLLDEPTLSLDPHRAEEARALLRRMQQERGMTLLYTSHNMQEVEVLCDRILFIHHGRLIADGTPAAVIERFKRKTLNDVFVHIAQGGELVAEEG